MLFKLKSLTISKSFFFCKRCGKKISKGCNLPDFKIEPLLCKGCNEKVNQIKKIESQSSIAYIDYFYKMLLNYSENPKNEPRTYGKVNVNGNVFKLLKERNPDEFSHMQNYFGKYHAGKEFKDGEILTVLYQLKIFARERIDEFKIDKTNILAVYFIIVSAISTNRHLVNMLFHQTKDIPDDSLLQVLHLFTNKKLLSSDWILDNNITALKKHFNSLNSDVIESALSRDCSALNVLYNIFFEERHEFGKIINIADNEIIFELLELVSWARVILVVNEYISFQEYKNSDCILYIDADGLFRFSPDNKLASTNLDYLFNIEARSYSEDIMGKINSSSLEKTGLNLTNILALSEHLADFHFVDSEFFVIDSILFKEICKQALKVSTEEVHRIVNFMLLKASNLIKWNKSFSNYCLILNNLFLCNNNLLVSFLVEYYCCICENPMGYLGVSTDTKGSDFEASCLRTMKQHLSKEKGYEIIDNILPSKKYKLRREVDFLIKYKNLVFILEAKDHALNIIDSRNFSNLRKKMLNEKIGLDEKIDDVTASIDAILTCHSVLSDYKCNQYKFYGAFIHRMKSLNKNQIYPILLESEIVSYVEHLCANIADN